MPVEPGLPTLGIPSGSPMPEVSTARTLASSAEAKTLGAPVAFSTLTAGPYTAISKTLLPESSDRLSRSAPR